MPESGITWISRDFLEDKVEKVRQKFGIRSRPGRQSSDFALCSRDKFFDL